MYELGRSPTTPTRRTYGAIGQVDVGVSAVSAIESILGGDSKAHERTRTIDGYYQMALSGNPQGVALLKAWVTDQPPHPAASVAYAQSKLAALGQPTGVPRVGLTGGVTAAIPTSFLLLGLAALGLWAVSRSR